MDKKKIQKSFTDFTLECRKVYKNFFGKFIVIGVLKIVLLNIKKEKRFLN